VSVKLENIIPVRGMYLLNVRNKDNRPVLSRIISVVR